MLWGPPLTSRAPVTQELWLALAADSEAVGARIPIGKGLAGTVAATGKPLNIADAHCDVRFDPSFDAATGFRTQSVLVWPISLQVRVRACAPVCVCVCVCMSGGPVRVFIAYLLSPALPSPPQASGSKDSGAGVIAVLQVRGDAPGTPRPHTHGRLEAHTHAHARRPSTSGRPASRASPPRAASCAGGRGSRASPGAARTGSRTGGTSSLPRRRPRGTSIR